MKPRIKKMQVLFIFLIITILFLTVSSPFVFAYSKNSYSNGTSKNSIIYFATTTPCPTPCPDKSPATKPPGGTRVSGVQLNTNQVVLTVGSEEKLTARILPQNAPNQNVIFNSDDPSIASVDQDGTVRGESEGSTEVSVITVDGGHKDTCTVNVVPPASGLEESDDQLKEMEEEYRRILEESKKARSRYEFMTLETETQQFKSRYFDSQMFEIDVKIPDGHITGYTEDMEWYSTNPELADVIFSNNELAQVRIEKNKHGTFAIFARSKNDPDNIVDYKPFVVRSSWRPPGFNSAHVEHPNHTERDMAVFQKWLESPEYADIRARQEHELSAAYHIAKFQFDVAKALAPKSAGGMYDAVKAWEEGKYRNVFKETVLSIVPAGNLIDTIMKYNFGEDYMYEERWVPEQGEPFKDPQWFFNRP
ncbi:Ig-like domain-containing protein [Candidatus Contubernalis alkaliaceticus]|uniref:Ig-like domain-containing protein n=1 Tax=Candidatus Contubernalis alkaliaceticus TaxID=338645 RepID=UPI001F4C1D6D|nr:Ig-like domain-containing protein [Candidatus Contubernalis alkalaceticus]UNC91454.1 Ig-like domain-containing protein [Candidatus Contubernalis alkalaceticus]